MYAGSKYFYAGTEHGKVRMYRLPLTGEHTEMKVGLGAVTQLTLGQEDSYLYAATADGVVSVFDVPNDTSRSLPKR